MGKRKGGTKRVGHPANTNNQLTTCGLTYDAAGNAYVNNGVTYTYDAENRLMTPGANNGTYLYDGDGNRMARLFSSSGTEYWRDLSGNTLLEDSNTGVNLREYIYFAGKKIARRDVVTNNVHYVFSDHLGSSSIITDALGTMASCNGYVSGQFESDYFPYGGEMSICNNVGDQNYKFTGKERDSESGLDNFGARYFTSSMGRFMTPDWAARPTTVPYAVFGDPQSLNLYNYVRNDPISRVDPDGHYEVNASGCGGNNQAKCQKKYDKATQRFEQARQKDLHSKDARVREAAAKYGDPGTKNGVHVGFEDLHGQGKKGSVNAMNSGKGKLIDIEVKVDIGLKGKSLQETVAHEGSHVGDDINFLTSYNFATQHYDPAANFTGQQTEFHGYQAGAGVTHEHGFGPNDADKINQYIQNNYDPNYLNNDYFPNNNNFPQ